MTTRPSALIQAASISLLLMLAPGTAAPQEQKEAAPGEAQPAAEQTAPPSEPASQPAEAVVQPGAQPQQAAETVAEEEEAETPPVKEEHAEHVIKQGDTLWDLSDRYLRDPFLWPFIWKANPSITNPDLIYAGNKLAIPSLAPIERAMQAPAAEPKPQLVEKKEPVKAAPKPVPVVAPVQEEPKPVEGLAAARVLKPKPVAPEEPEAAPGSRLILPEQQQQPIIDKYAMLSAGFVDSYDSSDEIVGAPEESKTTYGFGDLVYVFMQAKQSVNVGDKFLIFERQDNIEHPVHGGNFGHLIRGRGILQITANEPSSDVLTAKITLSFGSIARENLLVPYQEPVLVYPRTEMKAKDITGYILEVTDKHTVSGQTEFVYLDKGSADGVEPADRFTVYRKPEEGGLPNVKIGEVQVFLVKERSSTAIIRKSSDALSRGNMIVYAR